MQALDLYASIEEYLDFKEEVQTLYTAILEEVLKKDISTVLDIGCGQGDFCILLQHHGIKTYGVDLSQKQITLARKKTPHVECIDIKDIQDTYQGATATFDVLNYIPQNELEQFLQHTFNLLEDKGYFIFDINTLFGFEEIAQGTLTLDLEDKFIAIDANFEEDILYTDITVFTQENKLYNKQSGTIKQYYHDHQTLQNIFKKVGFSLLNSVDLFLHNDEIADKQILILQKDTNDS